MEVRKLENVPTYTPGDDRWKVVQETLPSGAVCDVIYRKR